MRDKSRLGECSIHYASREDAELAKDKLAYLRGAKLDEIAFEDITPDVKNNWLNQSNSDFDSLLPIANKETKFAKMPFQMTGGLWNVFAEGCLTSRDEWIYDFRQENLRRRYTSSAELYSAELSRYALAILDMESLMMQPSHIG